MQNTRTFTDKQLALIDGLSAGLDPKAALNAAGYSVKMHPAAAMTPAIVSEIRARTGRQLQGLAPRALEVVAQLLESGQTERIRLEAAKTILDRSGFIAPKASDGAENREKDLHTMSRQELEERAQRLASEIADRAKPAVIDPDMDPEPPESRTE